jgi:hypothetical protein
MEGYCSTGQSPQWAAVPVEEEEVDIVSLIVDLPRNVAIPCFIFICYDFVAYVGNRRSGCEVRWLVLRVLGRKDVYS